MLESVARGIVNAGNDASLPISLRENYSGRGMYQKTTTAIEYDDLGQLMQSVAEYARTCDNFDYDELIETLNNVRTDSMGRSYIIY